MNNIAFIYSGYHEHHTILENDRAKFASILDTTLWNHAPVVKALKTPEQFKDDLEQFKELEIENLLFYFTGHGKQTETGDSYYLQLEDKNDIEINVLMNVIHEVRQGSLPKRIAFILDACYSGKSFKTIREIKDTYSLEILTSTSANRTSIINKNTGLSEFTSNMVSYIESSHTDTTLVSLQEELSGTQGCAAPILKYGHMVLSNNHKHRELCNSILADCSENKNIDIDALRQSVHKYLPSDLFGIDIQSISSLENLIDIVVSKGYLCELYTILKEHGNAITVFESKCKDKEVRSYKVFVKEIFIGFTPQGEKNAYFMNILMKFEDGSYRAYERNIPVTKDDVQSRIEKHVEALTKSHECTSGEMQLIFSLPIELFEENYKTITYKENTLYDEFTILTKFQHRLDNTDKDTSSIRAWHGVMGKYNRSNNDTLIAGMCTSSRIKTFHDEAEKYIYFVKNDSVLADTKFLSDILKNGIPYVLTPQAKEHDIKRLCEDKWGAKTMNELEISAISLMNHHDNIHFISDGGYSEAFLKIYQSKPQGATP